MKVSEIIKLTAAGFKASDIKKLMEMEAAEQEAPVEAEETKEPEAAPEEPTENKDVKPDFEALYMKALDEVADLKTKLDAAQSANRSVGRTEGPATLSDEFKKVQDLFRR